MTVTSANWTPNQEHHASASLAAGATVNDNIDLDVDGYDEVEVFISIAFGSTPDDDCLVEIFPSFDGGTTFASRPVYTEIVPFVASITVIQSFTIKGHDFVRVSVTNQDTTDAVTYVGKYNGKEYETV